MGSLHCARICMDVIEALIGRCRGRPASQPRSPRLADSAAPGPPPRTKLPGCGGGAGLGSRGLRGRGGVLHSVVCKQGARTRALAGDGGSTCRWRSRR